MHCGCGLRGVADNAGEHASGPLAPFAFLASEFYKRQSFKYSLIS